MRSIVGKARDQVFAELAETYGMEEAAPFPAGTHNELAPERGGRQAPNVAVRWQSGTRAVGYVPYRAAELPDPAPARVIAFYLPQFHPIPENDLAWGKGFTEWRNVARALPQVEAQVQPKLPGELGFYDLRLPEVQERQAELAAEYGIGGFCFHFYWFGGKRLLEHPLRQYVQNPRIGLPFCLCWANENWTKRWDGLDADVIMAQQYSAEDDLAFIAYVATYFVDPRYIRVDGKPLLVVYRPGLFPEPAATAQRWRDYCRRIGVGEILLATTTAFELDDPASFGFDATVEFAPNNSAPRVITDRVRRLNGGFQGNVYDW
ncbi:MAG TPA: glycoside hydrolase family 99-like domain-containing protein, partial [Rhodanobacteraceae bacterium]|nr:glycoside hydrolase family 99-like domain-containing protein [Rhodanobacteraceae bacterium]